MPATSSMPLSTGLISRRRLLRLTALGLSVAPLLAGCDLSPWLDQYQRVPLAGRRFADQGGSSTRSLTATVRMYDSTWEPQQAAHDLFAKATAPITNMEASLSQVYQQPLDDPYGIDGRWTIFAGAAGVASYHRGLFFAVDRMCWSFDAGRLEEPDDHAFLVPLARVLRDRFNALGTAGEIDLWALLPEVEDLDDGFTLIGSFDHEQDELTS